MINDATSMFFFGNPEDAAMMYWEEAGRVTGPVLPRAPLDELTEQELRNLLTYQRIAIRIARNDGATEAVIDLLVEEYDCVFAYLASVSEDFCRAVESGRHRVIGGYTRENLDKYRTLAGLQVIVAREVVEKIDDGGEVRTTISYSAN